MPIMFADLVPEAIDRSALMLVRHHTNEYGRGNTPFDLWRAQPEQFELYQRCQGRNVFQHAKYLASFVVPPRGDTLFVGLYENNGLLDPPPDLIEPLTYWEIGKERNGFFYRLDKSSLMNEYEGKLSIDWGLGAINWVQYAKNAKTVTQITKGFVEETFPGYATFLKSLSEIEYLPPAWKARLQEAKGVYVLSCPKTRELYVGSATGEGGFYERWRQHARTGGAAKVLQSREASDYQVAIVEVAGTSASRDDILQIEQLWMRKLRTNEMGLNGGMLRDGKPAEKIGS